MSRCISRITLAPLNRYYDVFAFCPEPGQFAVLFMDVTDRKRAEQQIETLARFPDENPNPVMRIDRDGKLLYANSASQPLLEAWECAIGQVMPQQLARSGAGGAFIRQRSN